MAGGLNAGSFVNLEKDGSGNYVNKKVYKTRLRKVLSPFQGPSELIILAVETQTARSELYFEEIGSNTYSCT